MHRELAARSRSSFHQITGDRSRNIRVRHPGLVADAIRDVVGRAHLHPTEPSQ